jgi:hypothetical protein
LLRDKLQKFQSRAARVVTGANYESRSADVLNSLSWDTLENRRSGAKSELMYKILNDHTAPALRGSFVGREMDQTNYNLRNTATDLTLPKPKRELKKKSFKYSGALHWNHLPNEAKLASSLHSFRLNLYIEKCVYVVFRYSYLFIYFQTFLIFNSSLMEISPELMG